MANIVLIIIAVVMLLAILAAAIYTLVYFQDEADKNTAIFPKILVILGLTLTCTNILMLPLDVGNRNGGGLPMREIWIASYAITAILVIVLLPFTMFFYEAEDPDSKSVGKQIGEAFKFGIITVLVFLILTIVLWVTLGTAEIKYIRLTSSMVNAIAFDAGDVAIDRASLTSGVRHLEFQVTLILYGISMLTFFGVLFFVIFGGIGLAALPMDLINGFRKRPRFISMDVYAAKKAEIGDQASQLAEIGYKLKERLKKKGGRPKSRREKNAYRRFRAAVFILETDYNHLEKQYNAGFGPKVILIAWSWIQLVLGVLSIFLTILWIIHIIIYTAPRPPFHPFLNTLFIQLDRVFGLFGVLAYGLFSFYLLWCVFKGNFKFGLRVPFLFSIHPMKINGTLMNSFLFNTLLLLAASLAVTQFCTISFATYNRFSAIDLIFNVGVQNLRYIKYFWMYYYLALIVIAFISIIYFLKFPYEQRKANKKYLV